jgi:hypothetical protein
LAHDHNPQRNHKSANPFTFGTPRSHLRHPVAAYPMRRPCRFPFTSNQFPRSPSSSRHCLTPLHFIVRPTPSPQSSSRGTGSPSRCPRPDHVRTHGGRWRVARTAASSTYKSWITERQGDCALFLFIFLELIYYRPSYSTFQDVMIWSNFKRASSRANELARAFKRTEPS